MYNFVQKYFAQIVHFCIDNNRELLKVLHKHFLSKSLGGNLPVLYNNQWLATVCLHMSQERF